MRLFAVIGHSECGTTSAAVDAMLQPDRYLEIASNAPLRGIIDSILAGVHFGNRALIPVHGTAVRDHPNLRARLITLATLANTALSATVLERGLQRPCACGVYKLSLRRIGVRRAHGWESGLAAAPAGDTELIALVTDAAESLEL